MEPAQYLMTIHFIYVWGAEGLRDRPIYTQHLSGAMLVVDRFKHGKGGFLFKKVLPFLQRFREKGKWGKGCSKQERGGNKAMQGSYIENTHMDQRSHRNSVSNL